MSSAKLEARFYLEQVGPEAAPILQSLHADAFANYWNVSDFNDFFSTPGTLAWLAYTSDGTAAGMVVLRIQMEQADIITIAVKPQFRRRGIARALMQQAMNVATQQRAQKLFLDVEDNNIAAHQLYKELEFEQISRRKLYYRQKNGSYTDALVMMCKLA